MRCISRNQHPAGGRPTRSVRLGAAWIAALSILTVLLSASPLVAATPGPLPLYEVDLPDARARQQLDRLDLDVILRTGRVAQVLGWPGTEARLRAGGLSSRLLSPDYGAEIARRNHVRPPASAGPIRSGTGALNWNIPPVAAGSYGGYWSLDEVYALLDSVSTTDPWNIVGTVDTIGTSIEGRPILALVVTDRSRPLGTRPAVLYNALTHAREPMGMQALLYFLGALLEGYGTDPELTFLVQERELWFVPVVNPDGYEYNYQTWLANGTFGFWRKNLRNNDHNQQINDKDGVDLNRNFDLAWGYDNQGSSSNPWSEVYRGGSPFSEPETQALRDLCVARQFRTADNFHSFGDLCLYPWTYDDLAAPDSTAFVRIADARMRDTGYPYGRSIQILYAANGVALDWMYGEQSTKPKTYAFSTEVGSSLDQFYPPPGRIVPLAQLQLESNKVLAYAAGAYLTADSLRIESASGTLAPGSVRAASLYLRQDGVGEELTGTVTVHIFSPDPAVVLHDDTISFPTPASGEGTWPLGGDTVLLAADPLAVPGTRVPLLLEITDSGSYVGRDTLFLRVGEPTTVFSDDASAGLVHWAATGTWGTESIAGDPAFSDSPGLPYDQNIEYHLDLIPGLDLSGASAALLRFRTQWEIESEMDFGQVKVSADGGTTWVALPGGQTVPGHGTTTPYFGGTQELGEPGYAGTQRFWTEDEMDLSAFAGHPDLRLRLQFSSDIGEVGGGWWIDDIRVLAYAATATVGVAEDAPVLSPARLRAHPNPARTGTAIHYRLESAAPVRLSVFDLSGREIRTLVVGLVGAGDREVSWDGRDARGSRVSSGTYFIRLEVPDRTEVTKVVWTR